MALSDSAIRAAKPREKQFKLNDEKGLLLIVRPTGGKLWRLKYRFAGKEKQFTIGTYPEVGLKEARERRDAARALLAQGKDPSAEKKREKVAAAISAGNSFKLVAEEHIAKRQREGAATGQFWGASSETLSVVAILLCAGTSFSSSLTCSSTPK